MNGKCGCVHEEVKATLVIGHMCRSLSVTTTPFMALLQLGHVKEELLCKREGVLCLFNWQTAFYSEKSQ